MKNFFNFKNIFFFVVLGAIFGGFFFSCSLNSGNFVKKHGHLQVIGRDLCDKSGKPIQLKGMSYLDLEIERKFVNPDFFTWLRDDWGSTVVRAAMYTEHDERFVADRKYKIMREAIDYAIETGLYIIVDWHILYDGFPMKYKDEAIEFFSGLARDYKGCPNILYEICNEPNGEGMTWKKDIKPYAIPVIQAIRTEDPNAIIIVGSPEWSRRLDQVAASLLEFDNILYSFHFYTGSHGEELKVLLRNGAEAGLPIFITEWGTTLDSGDDGVYRTKTMDWMKIVNKYNMSWCNWSISERKEDSSGIAPNTPPTTGGTIYYLTPSGTYVRSLILGSTTDIFFADGFESESFKSRDWINNKTGISESESYTGYYSARFKKSSELTKSFSTEIFSDLEVSFFYKMTNFNEEEDVFKLEWYGNGEWTVEDLLPVFPNKWSKVLIKLPAEANGNPEFSVRLVSEFRSDNTNVFMDDFSIKMTRPSFYPEEK